MNRLVNAMTSFFGRKTAEEMTDDEMLAQLAEDMDGDGVDQNKPDAFYTDKKAEEDDPEEAMLKAMLEEMDADKSASHSTDVVDPLAKGPSIQSGEGGNVSPDPAPVTPEVAGPMTGGTAVKNAGDMPDFIQEKIDEKEEKEDKEEKKASEDSENDIEINASGDDPLGLMETTASADDELMSLYSDLDLKTAGDDEEDEDVEEIVEEVEEEPEDKEAAKKAAAKQAKSNLRPQPKTPSKGPKTVGNVQANRTAAQKELSDLEKLWESAPDVSGHFGTPGPLR